MRKGLVWCLVVAFGWFSVAMAWSPQDIPAPNSSGAGYAYSPRNFSVALQSTSSWETFPTSKLVLSGGNTATYTTAECDRVVVFSTVEGVSAAIYTPSTNQFLYSYPTLEVKNAIFHPGDFIRVGFIESTMPVIGVPQTVSTYSYSRYSNFGTTFEANVKATPGNVYSLYCHNLNGSTRYIQLHNSTTDVVMGATPFYSFLVAGNGTTLVDSAFFGPNGINFSSGISWAFSTTEATWGPALATDEVVFIQYK